MILTRSIWIISKRNIDQQNYPLFTGSRASRCDTYDRCRFYIMALFVNSYQA